MPTPTLSKPAAIIDEVARVDGTFHLRQERQDADFATWWLSGDYNVNVDRDGGDLGTEFRSFTANESQVFARKVIAILAGSNIIFQIPYDQAPEAERRRYDLKEQFMYGVINQTDENLARKVETTLQEQLATYIPLRGWGCVRALLRNMSDGTAWVDVRVWDARYVTWKVGARGLDWACYTTERAVRDLKSEYNVVFKDHDDDDILTVYDFYDATHNTVVVEDKVLKKRTLHGSSRCPVAVAPAGPAPRIFHETVEQTEEIYGESIFAANRKVFEAINEVNSYWLELTLRAAGGNYVYNSDEDEDEDQPNPAEGGSNQLFTIGENEKLAPLQQAEMTRDTALFSTTITQMVQRGALPYSSYGEVQFALSGFAITQLNQQILTVLSPQFTAMRSIYRQISDLLVDQFVSGKFNPMSLRGFGANKDWFQVELNPQELANLPPIIVIAAAELPQDDIQRLTLAQQARNGPRPLLPDRFIYDHYLKLPNASVIERQLQEQEAKEATEGAKLFTLMKSAAETGNRKLAMLHFEDLKALVLGKKLQLTQLEQAAAQMGVQPQGGQGVNGSVVPQIALNGGQPNEPRPQPPQPRQPGLVRPGARIGNGPPLV